jgi:cytochrome P450
MTMTSEPKAAVAPGRWPLVGHLFALAFSRMVFLTSLNTCGRLVEVRLGTQPAYVVTHPDLLHQMLVTDAHSFDKGRIFDKARRFVGNGLATASTETHRTHRRMLQPAFHLHRITAYTETMHQMAQAAIAQWRPGQILDVGREMDELVTSVVAKVLFSSDLGHGVVAEVHRSLPVIVRGVALRAVMPTGLEWALPDNRQYGAAVKRLKTVIADVIAGYRATGADHGDLLSMVIAAQDKHTGQQMDDQQVHDEVMTFLLGGIETSAASLAWVFHELAHHPEVEQKLHAELEAVLNGSAPTYEHVRRLDYTNRVVTEVLRVYASTLLMRRVIQPVILGGIPLPVGAELIYSPYAVHRDPRWYPNPECFDPDRWLPERAARIPRHAYVPFGGGARTCIANSFARTEIVIDVAVVASRWRLRPIPGQQVRKVAHAAVHPSRLLMTCHPRT